MNNEKNRIPLGNGDNFLIIYEVFESVRYWYFDYQDDETQLPLCFNEMGILFFALPFDKEPHFNYIPDWDSYDFTWLVGSTHEP